MYRGCIGGVQGVYRGCIRGVYGVNKGCVPGRTSPVKEERMRVRGLELGVQLLL